MHPLWVFGCHPIKGKAFGALQMTVEQLIERLQDADPWCEVHYFDEIAESLGREQPIVEEVIVDKGHVYLR